MEEPAPLQCGDCLVEVESRPDATGMYRVRCPSCGQEEALHGALKEAADYNLYEALGGRFEGLKTTGALRIDPTERHFRFVSCD